MPTKPYKHIRISRVPFTKPMRYRIYKRSDSTPKLYGTIKWLETPKGYVFSISEKILPLEVLQEIVDFMTFSITTPIYKDDKT